MAPRVSVIVPVRNDARRLQELLECLRAQTVPRAEFEVVVGDDGSTDLDPHEFDADGNWLQIVRQAPRTSFAARNAAVAHSRGAVLAFTDSDCRPEVDWLERGLAAMQDADLVAGAIKFMTDRPIGVWGLIDMETFLDQERVVRRGGVITANAFVARGLFERLSGFDESLPVGSDIVFGRECVEAGGRLTFAPDVVVWHPPRPNARSFLRKLWSAEHTYAFTHARDHLPRTPFAATLRTILPMPGTVRQRLRRGTPALDGAALRRKGAKPSPRHHLAALPAIYIVIPYVSAVAQTVGWWQGRRTRSAGTTGRRRTPCGS